MFDYHDSLGNRYISREDEGKDFLDTLIYALEKRKKAYDNSDKSKRAKDFYKTLEPLLICIDDISHFIACFQENEREILEVLKMASSMAANIVATTAPNQIVGFGPMQKLFKDCINGLVLGNPAEQSYLTPGLRKEREADIGYLYNNGQVTKLKLPLV